MYALGELYHQAQAEIQAALAEDTERVDLETTLAQVYFNSGQYTEAAQTCSHLIQKLPYSKEANRILGDILRAQRSRAADRLTHGVLVQARRLDGEGKAGFLQEACAHLARRGEDQRRPAALQESGHGSSTGAPRS